MKIVKNEWFVSRGYVFQNLRLIGYLRYMIETSQEKKMHFLKCSIYGFCYNHEGKGTKRRKNIQTNESNNRGNSNKSYISNNRTTAYEGRLPNGNTSNEYIINYKNMEIGKLLKYLSLNVKNEKTKGKRDNSIIEEAVVHLSKNAIIINNMNFLFFNMLLTIIHKSEIKISNKILNQMVLFLLHKHILVLSKKDINNTNSSWINIINLLSNISKNNKDLLPLLHKKIDDEKNNGINGNNGVSFIDKFLYRITNENYDYSMREISLLLHSCYILNIRSVEMFSFIYEQMCEKEYILNCLDIHIFVYSVHRLKLHNFVIFLENIKKDILKLLINFSNGQLVNILLAYTYFFFNNKEGNNFIQNGGFICTLFSRCMHTFHHFTNREFCNFLNFIIKYDIYLEENQKLRLLMAISKLLQHKCNEKLNLYLMTDVDIFTIVNFIYKYSSTDNYMFPQTDSVLTNLDNVVIHLVKKKKFKQNLLVYILHFYKFRISTASLGTEFFSCVLQYINVSTLEFKMKVMLLTSLERYLLLSQREATNHVAIIKNYYYKLFEYMYNDIYKEINQFMQKNKEESDIDTTIYTEKKEIFSNTDIKEILKLIMKRMDNDETDHQYCCSTSSSNAECDITKVKNNFLNLLCGYIIKNKIVELFPYILMGRSYIPMDICTKVELILKNVFSILNNYILEHTKNINDPNEQIEKKMNEPNGRDEKKIIIKPFNFIRSLNLCNEFIFNSRGNISNFLTNKNVILKYLDDISLKEENNINCTYFNLYVHMLLFDINHNILYFVNILLSKITEYIKSANFNYKQNFSKIVDIYISIIKLNISYYNIYIKCIYRLIFSKIFYYYEKLCYKYVSLLFYSNLIHLFLQIYLQKNFARHVVLSIRLLLRQFDFFLNSLDQNTYNLLSSNFRELSEYDKRDIKKTKNKHPLIYSFPLNELIYIYRTLTIFHFVNLYKYMNVYELKTFYIFCKILNFSIFKLNSFSIEDFTQTNRGASNIHSSVLSCLNDLFKNNERANIQCEQIVFPLFIIDILINKKCPCFV
ncbi:conserved Plasmodium protein, unknown function [Plasmodium malariae]|uniref:Uncharacterized protein n=1 Tax=Plasmodium malariae TaxID=5858 RepID=A0A1C3KDI6_PLAMA|nr:conserved Plasmodium protein, unknown function [Plasmodium malariae]